MRGRALYGRIDVVRASAQVVGADDEILVGVDGFPGADEIAPPAGFFRGIISVVAAAVGVAGQGVNDEDGVVFSFVQSAEGLVDHIEFGKALAVLQFEGPVDVQDLLDA